MLREKRQKFARIAASGIIRHLYDKKLYARIDYNVRLDFALRFLSLTLTDLASTELVRVKKELPFLSHAAKLEKGSLIRMDTHLGKVILEIPLPDSIHAILNSSQLPQGIGANSMLGVGLNDTPVSIDLLVPGKPHALFAGTTQSGKTTAAKVFVYGQARKPNPKGQLILFDVGKQGKDWKWLERSIFLAHPVIETLAECKQVVDWLDLELERRIANPTEDFQPLYICIDELKDLIDDFPECVGTFNKVARKGGGYNIHLIIITQYTQESILGKEATELKKLLLGYKLIGKVDSTQSAIAMTGIGQSGAERLTAVGDFLKVEDNAAQRFNVANLLQSDADNIPRLEAPKSLFDSETTSPKVVESGRPIVVKPVETNMLHLAKVVALWAANGKPPGLEKTRKTIGAGNHEYAKKMRIQAGKFLYFYNREAIGEGGLPVFDDISFELPKLKPGLKKT